ncbi:MAG: hypothetical protein WAW88_11630, partial [Nocardioides sp.]
MSTSETETPEGQTPRLPPTPPPRILPLGLIGLGIALLAWLSCLAALDSLHAMLGDAGAVATSALLVVAVAALIPA